MKKLFTSLILSFLISTLTAPKAHAGVGVAAGLFAVGTYNVNHGQNSPNYVGPLFLASWGIMATGFIGIVATRTIGGVWSTLFFLDADGNLPQSNIEQGLKTKFPFLDNQAVITNLSNAIKNKYDETKTAIVTLNEVELAPVLESSEMSDEQYQLIINELK